MANRVLVVGWDGADWDILDPLLDAGELPALGSLVALGPLGVLPVEASGHVPREVDPELCHRADNLGVYPLCRPGPGRARRVTPLRRMLEERAGHLRAAGVLDAHEEDVHFGSGSSL